MRRILITALAVAAPLLSLAATASAQPYEDVFGPSDAHDTGARRVTPVSACLDAAGGGFLAVGTTTVTKLGTPSDVLLVRTDATGVTDLGEDLRCRPRPRRPGPGGGGGPETARATSSRGPAAGSRPSGRTCSS